MKRILILLVALFTILISENQSLNGQYANSWIDFSKTYYKFQTNQDGLHRISFASLAATGLPLNGGEFQLFYKGQQIPIYVTTNGAFGANDYIEFYGQANDGEFDTQLFEIPDHQLQDYTCLFHDESTYFLTSDAAGPYQRIVNEANNIVDAPAPEEYFMYESLEILEQAYHFGEPYFVSGTFSYFSKFDEGEGWVSPIIRDLTDVTPVGTNSGVAFRVPTDALYPSAPVDAHVVSRVVGRNKSTGVIDDKHIQIGVDFNGNTYIDAFFSRFGTETYQFDIPLTDINTTPHPVTGGIDTRINYKAIDGTTAGFDYETRYSIAYHSITYPRAFDFSVSGVPQETFCFDLVIEQDKYFEVTNFNGGATPILYDLTTGLRIFPIEQGGIYKFKLDFDPTAPIFRKFFITSESAVINVGGLDQRNFTDYSNPINQGDYLIVTNDVLRTGGVDQVARYENYRSSAIGGGHQVVVADIDELYDQFAWGIEKHPMSIKNFVNQAIDTWGLTPEHLLIAGKGVRYDRTRFDPTGFAACLVPPYGYVASDLLFTTQTTQDYFPRIAVGRIPAKDSDELRAYLDKVEEYENWLVITEDCDSIENREWMKNALFIAKGWGLDDTDNFQNNLDGYKNSVTGPNLGYQVVDELQDTRGPIPPGQPNWYFLAPEVAPAINNGLALVEYIGHTSPYNNYFQFEMLTPNTYNNEGKYPFIMANACFVGKINDYDTQNTMAEDYVLEDNRGSIAFLSCSNLSSPGFMNILSSEFHDNLTDTHYGESTGRSFMYAIQNIYSPNDDGIHIISNEFIFAGDPAIELYHWDVPEYALDSDSLMVAPTGTVDPAFTSQLTVDLYVENWGKSISGTIDIVIYQYDANGNLVNQTTQTVSSPMFAQWFNFTVPLPVNSPDGVNQFVFEVDGMQVYTESCELNNTASVDVLIMNTAEGGCTDNCAPNYDPAATFDDGSCMPYTMNCNTDCTQGPLTVWDATTCSCVAQTTINGCTDPNFCNYNPNANCDDGSCLNLYGCTDPNACNYDPAATCYNGSCDSSDPGTGGNTDFCLGDIEVWNSSTCQYEIIAVQALGCTDPNACNYDPAANCDDGNCDFGTDASCPDPCFVVYGCTAVNACNYDATATCDDGSCDGGQQICPDPCNAIFGCMDPAACNYEPTANCDEDTCDYGDVQCVDPCNATFGCINPTACNYDPLVNCDDGTCEFASCAGCQLEIPLVAGWNIISSCCIPLNDDMEIIFAPNNVDSNIVQVKSLLYSYVPSVSFNTFPNWDITQGYQVKVLNNDTLIIYGTQNVDVTTNSIPLNTGWNIIAYWLDGEAEPLTVFGPLAPDVIQVKNLGGAVVPSVPYDGMGNMKKAQGYQVKMSNTASLTYDTNDILPRQANGVDEQLTANKNNGPTHFVRTNVPHFNNATLVILDNPNSSLAFGDEVGIFTQDGILTASFLYQSDKMGGLIYGNNNELAGKNGFEIGEQYIVKAWNKITNTEQILELDFIEGPDYFEKDALSIAVLKSTDTSTSIETTITKNIQISALPNPAQDMIVFELNLPNVQNSNDLRIQILNIEGKLMEEITRDGFLAAGHYQIPYNVSQLPNGVYFYQLLNDKELLVKERFVVAK